MNLVGYAVVIFAIGTAALIASLFTKGEPESGWISVAEKGNPAEYTHAWVYMEDGRISEDDFYPGDIGEPLRSNAWEGIRVSDGWWQNGTNLPGEKVIYYLPIIDPAPPAPPKA